MWEEGWKERDNSEKLEIRLVSPQNKQKQMQPCASEQIMSVQSIRELNSLMVTIENYKSLDSDQY